MARRTFALFASCSFHDVVVEEQMVHSGKPLEIGAASGPDLPLPDGNDWLVRALWTGPSTAAVQDCTGAMYYVEPGKDANIEFGPVRIRLYMAPQFAFKRAQPLSLRGSLAWLTIVIMATVLTGQIVWLGSRRCGLALTLLPTIGDVGVPVLLVGAPLAGLVVALFLLVTSENTRKVLPALGLPVVALLVPLLYRLLGLQWMSGEEWLVRNFSECLQQEAHAHGSPMTAEYLARLLRNDLEGEDRGVIEDKIDRPQAERKTDKSHQFFMPAGSEGPATRMGGAEQVAPTPVRTMAKEDQVALPAEQDASDQEPVDGGREIQSPEAKGQHDAVAEGLEVQPSEKEEGATAAAEEHEGWGFKAWYDEEDEAMDNLEIELMLRAAKSRLRIDPNDAAALSILSYYQYLAQDYDAAKKTYDRFIELFPDDPAGYNNKALVYKRLGEYQKEESLYRVALGLSPNDVTALNNLGVNLAHQKRFDEALQVMAQLEVLDPDDPYADLHRSKIYAEMGNDEQALAYLEKALEGMSKLDTLHHIEFRQDIRLDPSFEKLRDTFRFRAILDRYYGKDSPLQE